MPKKIPHIEHTFFYRQGLKLKPSENFVEKFLEIYTDLIRKNRKDENIKVSKEEAFYLIYCVLEAIIHCLDFGYDVWIKRTILFFVKNIDYRHNVKSHRLSVVENVKKIKINAINSVMTKIKNNLNKDNEDYQKFVEQKKSNYKKIKNYYKDFYGKEEWWTDK